jgi:hypothetical protein
MLTITAVIDEAEFPEAFPEDRAPIPALIADVADSPTAVLDEDTAKDPNELDPDLILDDVESSLETIESYPPPIDAAGKTETQILKPIISPQHPPPKAALMPIVDPGPQEPAGSHLPEDEAAVKAPPTKSPASVDVDLDLDLDDFDFGDHSDESTYQTSTAIRLSPAAVPPPASDIDPDLDLGDDFILPEDETPAPAEAGVASSPVVSNSTSGLATDISFLLDDAFGGESQAPAALAAPIEGTAPRIKLPANPAAFLKAVVAPQTYDLALNGNDKAINATNDLLGESVVLGRRAVVLNARKERNNVALYDPDGKLEEERTLEPPLLSSVLLRIKSMARILPHAEGVQLGQCKVTFQGENARALMETDGAPHGNDSLTVFLMSESGE